MTNGITYFRKNSPYQGDVTKNCALDGYEVDNNFFVLEGRDIKSVTVNGNDIVINLVNGESVKAKEALKDVVTNIDFDADNGILKVTQNGEIHLIDGFATETNKDVSVATETNKDVSVATDDSLIGNGTHSKPIGIAPLHRTGQFKPVRKFLDITCGEKLPCDCERIRIGERYVTKEYVSDYGLLYNYDAVKKIACDLRDAHSPWRIPTKEDWDGVLNAIEPCKGDKNHSSASSNKWLGKWAGKLLKSKDFWIKGCSTESCSCVEGTCIDYDTTDKTEEDTNSCENVCEASYCGKYEECDCHPHHHRHNTDGLDAFGFRVTPAGYADDGKNFVFFGERAYFWTATNSNCTSVYAKRFDYDRNSVYQSVVAGQNYLSLRLVKDYKGDNYIENEEILSSFYPTVLVPSEKGGKSIWTSINVSLGCHCGCSVRPNDGQGLSKTTHFFINEWDGHRWNRVELHEGDSVVVKNAPRNKKDIEYRVINNCFVEVNSMVYDDVIKEIQPKFDALNDKIENEINRSIAKDSLIDGIINDELKPNIEKNKSDIETVNTNLVSAIDNINGAIATVNQNLVDAINTINGGIATEIQERKNADDHLQEQVTENHDAIVNEVTRAIAKDNELEEKLATETEERKAKDAELEAKIDEHQGESDERYDELDDRVKANKASIDALETKTDETNSNLQHTNQVLSDFGVETSKAFDQINKVITDGFNTINGGIATEIQERKDADEAEKNDRISNDDEIRGTILTSEGTEFNTEDGVLTLKSKDATNDIKVQFTMNFGEF